jgi:membrane-associated phospholipid phosphatase
MKLKSLLSHSTPADTICLAFLQIYTLINLVFWNRIEAWVLNIALNCIITVAIFILAYYAETKNSKFLTALHRWYLYGLVFYIYRQSSFLGNPIHGRDYDIIFITIDHWIFGGDPTIWMFQFSHPIITELLQIAYFSYYFLIIIVGLEVMLRKTVNDMDYTAFIIAYGFLLSYVGYLTLPAVGPRFTLHDFHHLSQELPGLLFTEPMRAFLNAAENTSYTVVNPAATVHRNVFPSGHTEITLILVYLCYRYALKVKTGVIITVALLIIATVYLRYHYVIDLVAGAATALFAIVTAEWIYGGWIRIKKKYES